MTTHDRDKIIAAAKEADFTDKQWEVMTYETGPYDITEATTELGRFYAIAFEAGAASRDVEIAELVGVLGNVTAHLIAAHSLLSSGGKKAVASDTIFKIMLQDYEKSFEAGRKALAKVRKP